MSVAYSAVTEVVAAVEGLAVACSIDYSVLLVLLTAGQELSSFWANSAADVARSSRLRCSLLLMVAVAVAAAAAAAAVADLQINKTWTLDFGNKKKKGAVDAYSVGLLLLSWTK